MFSPHEGMMCEWNDANRDRYDTNVLQPVYIDLHLDDKKFYSLTDKFH